MSLSHSRGIFYALCMLVIKGLLSLGTTAHGASSEPAGAMTKVIRNQTDCSFNLLFHRPHVFEGTLKTVRENTFIFNGTPNWSEQVFSFSSPRYFVLISSGDAEGKILPITSNSVDQVSVVIPDGFSLTDLATDDADGEHRGDWVRIIPYWTVATLFESVSLEGVEVLFFPKDMPGVNIAAKQVCEYDASYTAWFDGVTNINDITIPPGESIVIRNRSGQDLTLTSAGAVPMTQFSQPIYTLASDTPQDLRIGLMSPMKVSLGESGLGEDGDQLLVFDESAEGMNKMPILTLTYNAQNDPAGWYQSSTWVNDTFYLEPGKGYILRKSATQVPTSDDWRGLPPYLK